MSQGLSLSCTDPQTSELTVAKFVRTPPKSDEVEVSVEAASVNPIDVRRATGYGQKLLSLKDAGKFPMVLGNDFAGTISAIGKDVSTFKVGDLVFGVKTHSRKGTHASHLTIKADPALITKAPDGHALKSIAALPYCFTTMWLAVREAGLTKRNAKDKKILVHGAAGGLGSLALQMLSDWGTDVTAIAYQSAHETCLSLGAARAIDLASTPFSELSRSFDATLNFATWDHDLQLLGCLKKGAMGHATTIHPTAQTFDENGFVGGAVKSLLRKRSHQNALPPGVKNYSWTIFQPNRYALTELTRLLMQDRAKLEIGLEVLLQDGAKAFDHIRNRQAGRAIILP